VARYFTRAAAVIITGLAVSMSFALQYAAVGLAIDPGNATNPIVRSVLGLAYGYAALRTTARNGRVRLVGEHPWCQLILQARWTLFKDSKIYVQQWPLLWSRFWDRGRKLNLVDNKLEKSDAMWATHLYAPIYMHRVDLPDSKLRVDSMKAREPCLSDYGYYRLGLLGPSIYPLYFEPIAWLFFYIFINSLTDNVETFASEIWASVFSLSVITLRIWPTLSSLYQHDEIVAECQEAFYHLLMHFGDDLLVKNGAVLIFPRSSDKRKLAAQILARPGKGVLYDFSLDGASFADNQRRLSLE
jgi:hypothetical protein